MGIMFKPFSCLAFFLLTFKLLDIYRLLTLTVPDEGYFRNMSCARAMDI